MLVQAQLGRLPIRLQPALVGNEEIAPYPMALVKLEEGPLVTAQLTGAESDEVAIGQPVEMITRKIREDGPEGTIVYGYKYRPSFQEAYFERNMTWVHL
jgi:uncharacterized OB-fold protein